MRFRGGRAANKQRDGKALTLHLFRHVNHLVERRGNQPGKADEIRVHLFGGFENFIRRDHHAKIDDFVVITLQHHADDVFADVMNVAFYRGNHHFAVTGALFFTGFDKRLKVGHRLFHDASGFHHLRQEHFAFAEQIADHVHAVHQRPFDHLNRAGSLLTRFFGVLFDKFGNALHQRIFEAFFHLPAAPLRLLGIGAVVNFTAAIFFRQFEQSFGAVIAAVEDHVLHRVAQLARQVIIDGQLTGIDDPHIHAVADRIVEEYGVDRLTDRVIAAEREGDVGDPAGDQRMRQLAFDVFAGADKVLGIVIVFFDTGRHRKDIRVKDNIFWREADLFGEDFVGATANLNFTFAGISLAHFVKGHHHYRSAVAANQFRMVDKGFDALFHRNRVNDAFALNAFQAFLNNFPLGGVDHDRHAGNVRLAGNQVEEAHHRRFCVEHPLVHVDIDNLRAVFHLLTRDVQRFAVLLFFD